MASRQTTQATDTPEATTNPGDLPADAGPVQEGEATLDDLGLQLILRASDTQYINLQPLNVAYAGTRLSYAVATDTSTLAFLLFPGAGWIGVPLDTFPGQ